MGQQSFLAKILTDIHLPEGNLAVGKAAVKAWIEKEGTCEMRFGQAKKKDFVSVDKTHLANTSEHFNPRDTYNALGKE